LKTRLSVSYVEKRRMMELVLLNLKLDSATLVLEINKPFDNLFEGLSVSSRRGDKI
jgi:hypothetical protein